MRREPELTDFKGRGDAGNTPGQKPRCEIPGFLLHVGISLAAGTSSGGRHLTAGAVAVSGRDYIWFSLPIASNSVVGDIRLKQVVFVGCGLDDVREFFKPTRR